MRRGTTWAQACTHPHTRSHSMQFGLRFFPDGRSSTSDNGPLTWKAIWRCSAVWGGFYCLTQLYSEVLLCTGHWPATPSTCTPSYIHKHTHTPGSSVHKAWHGQCEDVFQQNSSVHTCLTRICYTLGTKRKLAPGWCPLRVHVLSL